MRELIAQRLERLRKSIWHVDLETLPQLHARFLWMVRLATVMARDVSSGRLDMRATNLVYTTLLSLVPLLALSFSLLKTFGIHRKFEPVLLDFFAPLGAKGLELGQQIMDFVSNLRVGVLGVVGFAMVVYTGVSLMQKTERALNDIWGVESARSLLRRFRDYLSVLLLGPVLIVLALSLLASVSSTTLVQKLVTLGDLGIFIAVFGKIFSYALVIIAFTFLYVFIPNTKVKLSAALIGGLVAGVLWQWAGWAFTSFIIQSATYTAVYSSFAIVILFLIWLYASWTIVLLGATISYYAQYPGALMLAANADRDAAVLREQAVIAVMMHVARAFVDGQPGPSQLDLAQQCVLSPEQTNETVKFLIREKFLIATADTPLRYVPARALDRLELADLWRIARRGIGKPAPDIAAIIDDIELAAATGMHRKTLRDVVRVSKAPEKNG